SPPSGGDEVGGTAPIDLLDTLHAMARDRLRPVGTGGTARFRILTASVTRRRDNLTGALAVRLDVGDAEGVNTGFAEGRATAQRNGPIAAQRAAVYDLVKSLMDQMNIEFEYQIRNKLRPWVVEPPAEQSAPPARSAAPPAGLPPPPPRPPR